MHNFLRRHTYVLGIFLFFLLGWNFLFGIFPAFAEAKITDTSFMVTLSNLDPIPRDSAQSTTWKDSLKRIFETVSNIMLALIPMIAAICILVAGYFYIFSYSDDENVSRAKKIIKYNLIAMLVAFFSYAIMKAVLQILQNVS